MHNVDEVLGDLDLNISARVRASHWLNPVNPAAYQKVTRALLARLAVTRSDASLDSGTLRSRVRSYP